MFWNVRQLQSGVDDLAVAEALGAFNKDVAYRRWAATHGGVYVPASEEAPPNPLLAELVEERDVFTPNGIHLTLVTPASMTRQVHELSREQYGLRGHLTSLKPLRKENAPDDWEADALKGFDRGEKQRVGIEVMEGREHMRFMRPLRVEEDCIKCHAAQGYQVGDIRGGLSVAVPMAPYRAVARAHMFPVVFGLGILWLLGLGGLVAGTTVIGRRIRERHRAETALRRSRARYRDLFNGAPIAYFDIGSDGQIVDANKAGEMLTGRSLDELQTMRFLDLHAEESRPKMEAMFTESLPGTRSTNDPFLLVRKDGRHVHGLLSVEPVEGEGGVLEGRRAVVVDVSVRRQLKEQLRQAQRMESIGALAGGVAHDFNNMLVVVLLYCGLLTKGLQETDPMRKNVEEIVRAAERAKKLVRQLLAFGRKQVLRPQVVDLDAVVARMVPLLSQISGEHIEVVTRGIGNTAVVSVDPGQIEQVIVNLVVNARDAMARGGKLIVETRQVEIDGSESEHRHAVPPGPYVVLSVSDTGIGMDAATRDRIFEPYFTKNLSTGGLGLGLSSVFGIVKQSGGGIVVESAPGKGSTFAVYLPRAEGAELTTAAERDADPVSAGAETILLVEDDAIVRMALCLALEDEGYTVFGAGGGHEAIRIAERHERRFELLVTDVVMPQMSGPQLADEFLRLHPDVPVLFISGQSEEMIERFAGGRSGIHMLSKPFDVETLVRTMKTILDTAKPGPNSDRSDCK